MQFKVPQDVLRADKIVGFLTLRQLLICTLGGTLAYVLYTTLQRQYYVTVWLLPVLIVVLLTMCFSFVRFHDIAFEKLVLLFIEYNFKPRKRYWQKMQGDVVLSALASLPKMSAPKIVDDNAALTRRKKLEEATKIVDEHSGKMTHEFPAKISSNSMNK